jgi:hypothetical protein
MDERTFAVWAQAQRAVPARDVKTFTPTWGGFSADPDGDLKYAVLGELVAIWAEPSLTLGTSNSTLFSFTFTNAPSALIPESVALTTVLATDNGGSIQATASIANGGPNLVVSILTNDVSGTHIVPNTFGWTNVGVKGLAPGFVIIYPLH